MKFFRRARAPQRGRPGSNDQFGDDVRGLCRSDIALLTTLLEQGAGGPMHR